MNSFLVQMVHMRNFTIVSSPDGIFPGLVYDSCRFAAAVLYNIAVGKYVLLAA